MDDEYLYQHCSVANALYTIRLIKIDLNSIVKWSSAIGIRINVDTTYSMILGSNYNLREISKINLPSIVLNNKVVPFVSGCKNLGVMVTVDLALNDYISKIASKKSKGLPLKVKILLVEQLVVPHFDYGL